MTGNFLVCYFLVSSFVRPVLPKLDGFLFVTFPLFAQQ